VLTYTLAFVPALVWAASEVTALAGVGRPEPARPRAGRRGAVGHLVIAGAPAAQLDVADEPCRHTTCDTPDRLQRGAFSRVLSVAWPLLRTWRGTR
jgi:hypothetical protein